MELKNSEECVEISLEKEDEKVEIRFFSHNTLNPDSKIRILKQYPDIEIREYALLPDLTNPD